MEKDLKSLASALAKGSESRCKYKSIKWESNHLGSQLYFSGLRTFKFLPKIASYFMAMIRINSHIWFRKAVAS